MRNKNIIIAHVSEKGGNFTYRAAVSVALAASLFLFWINGAVGIIGNEANPANQMYFGVILIGFIGALIARFRPRGMSHAMYVTALAQALVPIIALIIWKPQAISWGAPGIFGVFILNGFFVLLFIASATLFRNAAIKAK